MFARMNLVILRHRTNLTGTYGVNPWIVVGLWILAGLWIQPGGQTALIETVPQVDARSWIEAQNALILFAVTHIIY